MPNKIYLSPKQVDLLAHFANVGLEPMTFDQREMLRAMFSRIVLAAVDKVHAEENSIGAQLIVSSKDKP